MQQIRDSEIFIMSGKIASLLQQVRAASTGVTYEQMLKQQF